jgi:hypothetical protein
MEEQYMTTNLPLKKILQGILHTDYERKQNHERTGSLKSQEKKSNQRVALFGCTQSNPETTKTNKWQESLHTYQY